MHELYITQTLLEKVLNQAEKGKLSRVSKIFISLGVLSGYVDESIELYWKEIAKDTIAVNAQIVINRFPGKLKCISCIEISESKYSLKKCPKCGSSKLLVVGGDELILSKIEGEDE